MIKRKMIRNMIPNMDGNYLLSFVFRRKKRCNHSKLRITSGQIKIALFYYAHNVAALSACETDELFIDWDNQIISKLKELTLNDLNVAKFAQMLSVY